MSKPLTCCVCCKLDPDLKTVELKRSRHNVLKSYLANVKSIHDPAHEACLLRLGIFGIPRHLYTQERFPAIFDKKIMNIVEGFIRDVPLADDNIEAQKMNIMRRLTEHLKIAHPTVSAITTMEKLVSDMVDRNHGRPTRADDDGENQMAEPHPPEEVSFNTLTPAQQLEKVFWAIISLTKKLEPRDEPSNRESTAMMQRSANSQFLSSHNVHRFQVRSDHATCNRSAWIEDD